MQDDDAHARGQKAGGMTGSGAGYVTDIAYVTGYHRQQSPAMIALGCLLGGVASPIPGPGERLNYLELGCGQGFGAMVLAASNPDWQVNAIDFNPMHIAAARAWAAEAALDNIRFIEADLATFAEDSLSAQVPEADFVSMHGVWSWVSPAVRSGIVRLLRNKVKPGGAVHVSYNALPAWGAALGMQRVMRECGLRLGSRSDRQAEQGVKIVAALHAAGALQLVRSPWVSALIERLGALPSQYLAHEYMNDAWAPCFHADVAAAFADAELDWAGSADPIENFPELTLTAEQQSVARRFDDPLLRELVKDACLDRSLRHDVFVRGARRISPPVRDAALMGLSVALNVRPEDMPFEADMPAGRAALNRGFYGPIAEAMATGPRRVDELLDLPTLDGRRDNPAELVGILVGLDLAEPALRPGAAPAPSALRFNRTAAARLARAEHRDRPVAAASNALGAGAPCSPFDLHVLDRALGGEGEEKIGDWAWQLGRGRDHDEDGDGEAEIRAALGRCLRERLPILHAAGVF